MRIILCGQWGREVWRFRIWDCPQISNISFTSYCLPRICLKSQHTKLCWPGCWLNRFSQNSKLVIQTGYPQYPQYKRSVIHSIFRYKQTQFSFISRERLLKCNLCWIFLPGPGRIEGGIKFINIFLPNLITTLQQNRTEQSNIHNITIHRWSAGVDIFSMNQDSNFHFHRVKKLPRKNGFYFWRM